MGGSSIEPDDPRGPLGTDESWRGEYHDVYLYEVSLSDGVKALVVAPSVQEVLSAGLAEEALGFDDCSEFDLLPLTIRRLDCDEEVVVQFEDLDDADFPPNSRPEDDHDVVGTAAMWANHMAERAPIVMSSTAWEL